MNHLPLAKIVLSVTPELAGHDVRPQHLGTPDHRDPPVDLSCRCSIGFAALRLKWTRVGLTRDTFSGDIYFHCRASRSLSRTDDS